MSSWIKSRFNRCTQCGRATLGINGKTLCKTCHTSLKLRPVNLLATLVGLLPQSYFDVLAQLNTEYRCTGCRSVNFGEIVTCETCMEHTYCSFPCQQAYRRKHTPACLYLLIAKRTSDWCQRFSSNNLFLIFSQAKTLDDTGCPDFQKLSYRDWSYLCVGERCELQQTSVDTFTKTPANLTGRFSSTESKDLSRYKSTSARQFKNTEKKTKQVGLQMKKRNKNVSVGSDMDSVDTKVISEMEQKNHFFETFGEVKMMIANGMFARWFCDNGSTFGKGWWKYVKNRRSRSQTQKIYVKPLAAILHGDGHLEFGLSFIDFYGDSDSEEIDLLVEDASGSLSSVGVFSEENSITSKGLPTDVSVENNKQTQDMTICEPFLSEHSQQMQLLPGNNTVTDKQNGMTNTRKKKKVRCMFCRHVSCDIKVCARCGVGKYCSKSCQINDFIAHKPVCKQMGERKRALSLIPSFVTEMMESKYGTAKISFTGDFVPDNALPEFPWTTGYHCTDHVHVLVKIIAAYPNVGFVDITVEDSSGVQETLIMKCTLAYSMFHAPNFGIQMHLRACLRPGNYILIIDARRTPWFRGGMLFCKDEQCFFIIMK